jgi:hypothetical protein
MQILTKKHIALIFVAMSLVAFSVLVAAIGTFVLKERQVMADEAKRKAVFDKILDAASIGPTQLTINYSNPISLGSPLIFGGAHTPPPDHLDAWDKIADAGVTSVRVDFAIDRLLPKNISIEDYRSNKNNIQDTKNWDQKNIDYQLEIFNNAKRRGMKVIGIADYSINWLSYSNTNFGVPKDWNIYKDIVKKTYKIYRPYVDYLEIWNEPNLPDEKMFLNVTGSNLTKKEAYEQIYNYTSSVIREVDTEINDGKKTPLGGPVSSTKDDASFLEPLLSNPQTAQYLDFVSYHQYEKAPTESDIKYKDLLKRYNKPNLPIFITEWSYSPKGKEVANIIPTDAGITYAGSMLLNYLHMGIAAANYHTVTALMDNKPYGLEKNHAFYKWNYDKAELLPLSRTWRLLSKQMGLGKGESKIHEVKQVSSIKDEESDKLNTVGFKNLDGQYGVAIVNDSSSAQTTEVNLENTGINGFVKVQVYYANASNDAKMPVYEGTLKAKGGEINFAYYIPEVSVVGMTFTEVKEWYDFLHLPVDKIIR